MTTEASVRNAESTLEASRLGAGFIRWGTGLFIFGLIIGYGPLLHYIHGAVEGDVHFPDWNRADWRETGRREHPADARHLYAMSFVTLER